MNAMMFEASKTPGEVCLSTNAGTNGAEAILTGAREALARQIALNEKTARYRSLITNAASHLDSVRVMGGARDMEDSLIKLTDLVREGENELKKTITALRRAEFVIAGVDDAQGRNVLELRYLSNKKWREIASALMMDDRWVFRLHKKALAEANRELARMSAPPCGGAGGSAVLNS